MRLRCDYSGPTCSLCGLIWTREWGRICGQQGRLHRIWLLLAEDGFTGQGLLRPWSVSAQSIDLAEYDHSTPSNSPLERCHEVVGRKRR